MYHFVFSNASQVFSWLTMKTCPVFAATREGGRKRLIAVLAVFSLGNDKQFGGTPLSQIESLQTNCNCQIAQFRTIRRIYPAAKRQHRGKNRFSDRKILDIEIATVVTLLQNW